MEVVFLELLNDVADRVLLYRVGLNDGQSPLQRLHNLVVGPWSLVVG